MGKKKKAKRKKESHQGKAEDTGRSQTKGKGLVF